MRVFAPLRHRPIALLWSGQVLSCIGDEVNKVALAWLSASLLGVRAGYVGALYAASAFAFSALGGVVAERWERRATLIGSDLVRAAAVLALPIASAVGAPLLPVLLAAVTITAAASAFFEPALRSSLADLAPRPDLLFATSGLMETTARFARLLGPLLVAVFGAAVPVIHFFTLDGVSFLCSAASLSRVRGLHRPPAHADGAEARPRVPLKLLLEPYPMLRWVLGTSLPASATWILVLPTGMALLARHRFPSDVRVLGLLIAGYGAGNLTSNLIVGSLTLRRPERLVSVGRFVCGLGFIGMAFAPNLPAMMICAALAATGGPLTDVGFMSLVQAAFGPHDAARIYRLASALAWGSTLVLFAVSPLLFDALGVPVVIAAAGLGLALTGAAGFVWRPPLRTVEGSSWTPAATDAA